MSRFAYRNILIILSVNSKVIGCYRDLLLVEAFHLIFLDTKREDCLYKSQSYINYE